MTLDQLMAFTVNSDHERQEQVWEAVQRSYNKEAYQIRRLLTESAVRASDKRAQYVGEDYLAAGGPIMRDLFPSDDGGWLQDVALLERLVAEKLARRRAHSGGRLEMGRNGDRLSLWPHLWAPSSSRRTPALERRRSRNP